MSDYGIRVNRALNYAQKRLPAHIELDEVAKMAAFSPYHFHRVFMLIVGESFAGFMRKRRLEWAAMELLHTTRRILDISLDAGYETQESFARAFKRHFNITPARFRSRVREPGEAFSGLQTVFEVQLGELMKPEIVQREHFTAIGIKRDYNGHNFAGALQQWHEFWARSAEVETVNSHCYYGLSVVPTKTWQKNNCSGIFQYLAAYEGLDDSRVPEGMFKLSIPPQRYARYTYRGPVAGFQAFIMSVWTHYLPESGLQAIESPEIEVYDERFNLESHESEMDYLVPIA